MISRDYVWLNDTLLPASEAWVSVNDRGFLYGDGFFETLKALKGRPHFLAEYLKRLEASAQAFRIPFPQEIYWQGRLHRLLEANGLIHGMAAVKILADSYDEALYVYDGMILDDELRLIINKIDPWPP